MVFHIDLLLCNKCDRYIPIGFIVWGWVPGWWLISHEEDSVCGGFLFII